MNGTELLYKTDAEAIAFDLLKNVIRSLSEDDCGVKFPTSPIEFPLDQVYPSLTAIRSMTIEDVRTAG